MRKLLPFLLLFLPSLAAAQGVWVNPVIQDNSGMAIAGASVNICPGDASTYTAGTPCQTLSNVYSNLGLSVPVAQPLTTNGYGQIDTGSASGFGFAIAPGTYTMSVYGGTVVPYNSTLSANCPPTGVGCGGGGGGGLVYAGSVDFCQTVNCSNQTPENYSPQLQTLVNSLASCQGIVANGLVGIQQPIFFSKCVGYGGVAATQNGWQFLNTGFLGASVVVYYSSGGAWQCTQYQAPSVTPGSGAIAAIGVFTYSQTTCPSALLPPVGSVIGIYGVTQTGAPSGQPTTDIPGNPFRGRRVVLASSCTAGICSITTILAANAVGTPALASGAYIQFYPFSTAYNGTSSSTYSLDLHNVSFVDCTFSASSCAITPTTSQLDGFVAIGPTQQAMLSNDSFAGGNAGNAIIVAGIPANESSLNSGNSAIAQNIAINNTFANGLGLLATAGDTSQIIVNGSQLNTGRGYGAYFIDAGCTDMETENDENVYGPIAGANDYGGLQIAGSAFPISTICATTQNTKWNFIKIESDTALLQSPYNLHCRTGPCPFIYISGDPYSCYPWSVNYNSASSLCTLYGAGFGYAATGNIFTGTGMSTGNGVTGDYNIPQGAIQLGPAATSTQFIGTNFFGLSSSGLVSPAVPVWCNNASSGTAILGPCANDSLIGTNNDAVFTTGAVNACPAYCPHGEFENGSPLNNPVNSPKNCNVWGITPGLVGTITSNAFDPGDQINYCDSMLESRGGGTINMLYTASITDFTTPIVLTNADDLKIPATNLICNAPISICLQATQSGTTIEGAPNNSVISGSGGGALIMGASNTTVDAALIAEGSSVYSLTVRNIFLGLEYTGATAAQEILNSTSGYGDLFQDVQYGVASGAVEDYFWDYIQPSSGTGLLTLMGPTCRRCWDTTQSSTKAIVSVTGGAACVTQPCYSTVNIEDSHMGPLQIANVGSLRLAGDEFSSTIANQGTVASQVALTNVDKVILSGGTLGGNMTNGIDFVSGVGVVTGLTSMDFTLFSGSNRYAGTGVSRIVSENPQPFSHAMSAGAYTLTFGTAYLNANPICSFSAINDSANTVYISAISKTAVTFTSSSGSDTSVVQGICEGNPY